MCINIHILPCDTHYPTGRACCSVLQCVAACCSVLQCVAACCSVLQRCFAVCHFIHSVV